MIEVPSVVLAFAAGVLSFLSPCCLPLVPGYLATVGGANLNRESPSFDLGVLNRSLQFVGAFSLIFILLGLGATAAGTFLTQNDELLNKLAGATIIAMGVFFLAAILVPRLNFEMRSARLSERAGRSGPIVAGTAFALAWTPCVGPTLGAILTLASTSQGTAQGAFLLAVYSAGLGLPFLISSFAFSAASQSFEWFRKHRAAIQVASGLVLIGMGLLVFSGELFRMNIEAQRLLNEMGLNVLSGL